MRRTLLDLPHAFPLFGVLHEAAQCRSVIAAFIAERLASPLTETDGNAMANVVTPRAQLQ